MGITIFALLIYWVDTQSIGNEIKRVGWVIPINIIIHLFQLFLAASAWRLLVGELQITSLLFLKFRMIREGVNSLLPVAQIGGPIIGIRLIHKRGVLTSIAAGGTTLDITIEAIAQLFFTFLGIFILTITGHSSDWYAWSSGGLILGILGLIAFVVAQRSGLMKIIEWGAKLIQHYFPRIKTEGLIGLHDELMRLQKNHLSLILAFIYHCLAWGGGSLEIYLTLYAMGHPVGIFDSIVIESLVMAARSLGFAVPGALGVQEGGFIVVAGLFGVTPDNAIVLSVIKRAREISVAIPSVIMWQWPTINNKLLKYLK